MAGRFTLEAVFEAVDRITGPIGRMQTRAQRFTRSVTLGMRRLDKATSAVSRSLRRGLVRGFSAATIAAGGTLLAMNGMAAEADELVKSTREMNFPIEEFQKYRFAAEQAGVSNDKFEKSLSTMNKRLGEARIGQGRMQSALGELHPEMMKQLLASENTSDALDVYVNAMRGIEDPAKRAAISSALFSKAGMDMGRISRMSASEIEHLMNAQMKNGIITEKQAEQAEKYNDAMGSMNLALDTLKRDILMPLLPLMTDLFGRTREWVNENREIISGEVLSYLTSIRENFGDIVKWLGRIGTGLAVFFAFQALLKSFIVVMTAVNLVMAMNPIGLIVLGVLAAVAAFTALVYWIDDVAEGFNKMPYAIKVILAPLTILINAIKYIKDNWDVIRGGFSKLGGSLGFGGDDDEAARTETGDGFNPQTVSPQEIVARTISEQNSSERNTVTIRDETGRAQAEGKGPGRGVNLQSSGAF